ncbi:hypothetical protein WA026_009213 [Henosepilachna vigintioctopunctata]
MAPNLVDTAKSLFRGSLPDEPTSAEPLQIINNKVKNGNEINEDTKIVKKKPLKLKAPPKPEYKWRIVWRNVIAFIYLHTFSIYGLYLVFYQASWWTTAWAVGLASIAGQGITAGAHRLWAHRTYKAKLPLRIFLAALQTIAFQNHLYEWVRDHRVHHKFTDTDADPHNATRGFFFSHIGWLMLKKHKEVFLKGKKVDLSDLRADPVVMFQKKYYLILMPLLCFVFPTFVPWYYWNENFWNSWYIAGVLRYTISLNITWLVNSAAHIWGMKPYDRTIAPTENIFVAVVAQGEGWHNYHHVFPWDYKAAELGNYKLNFSTAFLDFMQYIGQAHDLKTATKEMIDRRARRTGDGTRVCSKEQESNPGYHSYLDDGDHLWGWGDKDMSDNEVEFVLKTNNLTER